MTTHQVRTESEALRSQQFEIVQLVAVLHDGALDLAGIDPCDEVLHTAGHEISRIRNDFRADSHVALFDECDGLIDANISIFHPLPASSEEQTRSGGEGNIPP